MGRRSSGLCGEAGPGGHCQLPVACRLPCRLVGSIKHGDDPNMRVLTPTGLLYHRDAENDGGGLSGGGIAGVAVGAATAALLAAAGTLWALRRRRRRRQQAAAEERAKSIRAQLLLRQSGGAGPPAGLAPPPGGAEVLLAAGLSPEAAGAVVGAAAGRTSSPDPVPASAVPSLSTAGQLTTPFFSLLPLPPPQHRRWLGGRPSPDRELAIELQRVQQAEQQQGAAGGLAAALPRELRSWLVPPAEFAYARLPDGRLQELGAGARWAPAQPQCSCAARLVQLLTCKRWVAVFSQTSRLARPPALPPALPPAAAPASSAPRCAARRWRPRR